MTISDGSHGGGRGKSKLHGYVQRVNSDHMHGRHEMVFVFHARVRGAVDFPY